MLSFGSAAYRADKELLATFSATLEPLPGAEGHLETMPRSWFDDVPHSGVALDDAIEQGARSATCSAPLPARRAFRTDR